MLETVGHLDGSFEQGFGLPVELNDDFGVTLQDKDAPDLARFLDRGSSSQLNSSL